MTAPFKPPGLLRRLLMVAGDYLFVVLLSLGWQPKEEREPGKHRPHP